MKFTRGIVNKASENLIKQIYTNPSYLRNKLRKEPKFFEGIKDMVGYIASESEINDRAVMEAMYNSAVYGVILREEVAKVIATSKKEDKK